MTGTVSRTGFLVLTYHRVHARPDAYRAYDPDVAAFTRQIRVLARLFHPMTLREAVRRRLDGTLPERAAVVTFDDGYRDNLDVALPVLERFGVPATVFVATGFSGAGAATDPSVGCARLDDVPAGASCMWNDRVIEAIRTTQRSSLSLEAHDGSDVHLALDSLEARVASAPLALEALKYLAPDRRNERVAELEHRLGVTPPDRLMMAPEEIRRLHSAGIEIGGHTVTHPILATLPADLQRAEIEGCRAALESWLQAPVDTFAYPNGRPGTDFDATTVELVRAAGYRAAVTTEWGRVSDSSDDFALPRVGLAPAGHIRVAAQLMRRWMGR